MIPNCQQKSHVQLVVNGQRERLVHATVIGSVAASALLVEVHRINSEGFGASNGTPALRAERSASDPQGKVYSLAFMRFAPSYSLNKGLSDDRIGNILDDVFQYLAHAAIEEAVHLASQFGCIIAHKRRQLDCDHLSSDVPGNVIDILGAGRKLFAGDVQKWQVNRAVAWEIPSNLEVSGLGQLVDKEVIIESDISLAKVAVSLQMSATFANHGECKPDRCRRSPFGETHHAVPA